MLFITAVLSNLVLNILYKKRPLKRSSQQPLISHHIFVITCSSGDFPKCRHNFISVYGFSNAISAFDEQARLRFPDGLQSLYYLKTLEYSDMKLLLITYHVTCTSVQWKTNII